MNFNLLRKKIVRMFETCFWSIISMQWLFNLSNVKWIPVSIYPLKCTLCAILYSWSIKKIALKVIGLSVTVSICSRKMQFYRHQDTSSKMPPILSYCIHVAMTATVNTRFEKKVAQNYQQKFRSAVLVSLKRLLIFLRVQKK